MIDSIRFHARWSSPLADFRRLATQVTSRAHIPHAQPLAAPLERHRVQAAGTARKAHCNVNRQSSCVLCQTPTAPGGTTTQGRRALAGSLSTWYSWSIISSTLVRKVVDTARRTPPSACCEQIRNDGPQAGPPTAPPKRYACAAVGGLGLPSVASAVRIPRYDAA